MPQLLALVPVPLDAVDLKFQPPGYSSDFHNTVGNAISDTDGWDAVYNDMTSALEVYPSLFSGLDGALGQLVSIGDPINLPWEQDFALALASAVSGGDGVLQQMSLDLVPGALPKVPTIIPAIIAVVTPITGPPDTPPVPISFPPGLPPVGIPQPPGGGPGECNGQICQGPGPGSGPPVLIDCTSGTCEPTNPPPTAPGDSGGGGTPGAGDGSGGGGTAPGGVGAAPGPIYVPPPPPVDVGPPIPSAPPGDSGGGSGGFPQGTGGEGGDNSY